MRRSREEIRKTRQKIMHHFDFCGCGPTDLAKMFGLTVKRVRQIIREHMTDKERIEYDQRNLAKRHLNFKRSNNAHKT